MTKVLTLADQLLQWRPDAFAYIAKRLTPPVTPQHVRYVARGERHSAKIEKALKYAARNRRFP